MFIVYYKPTPKTSLLYFTPFQTWIGLIPILFISLLEKGTPCAEEKTAGRAGTFGGLMKTHYSLSVMILTLLINACGKDQTVPSETTPVSSVSAEEASAFIESHIPSNPDDLVGADGQPVHFETQPSERNSLATQFLGEKAAETGLTYEAMPAAQKLELIQKVAADESTPRETLRALFDAVLMMRILSASTENTDLIEEDIRTQLYPWTSTALKTICDRLKLAPYWAALVPLETSRALRKKISIFSK
jgi:hypothetical protein